MRHSGACWRSRRGAGGALAPPRSVQGLVAARARVAIMSDSAAASEPWTTATPAGGFQLGGTPKLRFVTAMFDAIAAQYDTLNLLLSLGQTTVWRWMALAMLPLR